MEINIDFTPINEALVQKLREEDNNWEVKEMKKLMLDESKLGKILKIKSSWSKIIIQKSGDRCVSEGADWIARYCRCLYDMRGSVTNGEI